MSRQFEVTDVIAYQTKEGDIWQFTSISNLWWLKVRYGKKLRVCKLLAEEIPNA